jgi:iron complex outermembrane receptor protein
VLRISAASFLRQRQIATSIGKNAKEHLPTFREFEYMNTFNRVALLATASLPLFISGQAFAQSADEATDDGAIIVTARRVEERLQDVPISISVVDQDRLNRANISSASDLSRVVPGLNVQNRYSAEQSTFSIRGFSQELRTSSSVGTYFGEVVAPRGGGISLQGGDGAGPGFLFDLQNVQVLKGPQGTLFGRNTTGGAVLLAPRKPTDLFEGYVEASYGNYDMKRIQAVVNAPLADWARLRLGIDRQVRDGYLTNVSGIGPKDFGDVSYTALRGSLVLDLAPNLENYTIVSYSRSDNNGVGMQLFRANGATFFGARATDQVARLNASDDKWQVEQKLSNPRSLTKQFQVINTTTWIATDNLTVKNIASYSTFIQDLRQDIFAANLTSPIPGTFISTSYSFNPEGTHTNDQKNFTEELQFQGKAMDSRLNYQFGLYYEHSTPRAPIMSASPSAGAICLIGPFNSLADTRCTSGNGSPNSGTIEYINMAAYAQGTYALTDQLKATAGVRYTYDRSRGMSQGFTVRYLPPAPGQFVAPTTVGCAPGYPTATNCVFEGRTSTKKPTWTLNLAYNPTNDTMVYGTYSRGYRQGAVSPNSVAGSPFFGPEKIDNFELGLKTSFSGAVSGNLNLAGFYSKLANQQLQVGLQNTIPGSSNFGQTATSIFNAGKSRIYGVELDGMLRLADFLRINGSGNYVNTKLQSISVPATFPGFNVVLPSALAGDPLPFTPKWSGNVSATVTVPTDEAIGRVELTAAYRYSSSYSTAASSLEVLGKGSNRSSAVKQIDLNLDWRDVAGAPVDISLFASNVTNQFTTVFVQALYNSFGFDTRVLGMPRMYGARVKVRFGGN